MQTEFPHIDLDLVGAYCPMAFVKLRVFADTLSNNETFTVIYEQTNANKPLIKSIQNLGYLVLDETVLTPNDNANKAYVDEHHRAPVLVL